MATANDTPIERAWNEIAESAAVGLNEAAVRVSPEAYAQFEQRIADTVQKGLDA